MCEGLQNQIDTLKTFCDQFKLTVNVEKTKVLVFEKRETECPDFLFNGAKVERVSSFKYLGVEFHGTKGFTHATEKLNVAAKKALFAMYRRCGELHISNPTIKCKLFDSLVSPIQQYACEVWAVDHHNKTCKLESMHRAFLRKLLGVHEKTPTSAVLGEFGRLPLEHCWWKRVIRYWKRLAGADSSRLIHAAYQECIQLHASKKTGWYTSVLNWLRLNGIRVEETVDVDQIVSKTTQNYLESLGKGSGSKTEHYISLKGIAKYECEPYLNLGNCHFRRIIAQIRTGSHFLEVEMGRRTQIPRENRTCKCCNTGKVEDEAHFIFECEAYESVRLRYRDIFQKKTLKTFLREGDMQKTANYLTECRNLRTSILS